MRWLSRSLFSLRSFSIRAQNWKPRILVQPFLIAPVDFLAGVGDYSGVHHIPFTREAVTAMLDVKGSKPP